MPVIEDHTPSGLGISACYAGDRGAERPVLAPHDHLHNKHESAPGTVRPRGGPHHRCHPIRCGALTLLQVIHIALPSAMRRAIRWAFNRFVYRADGRDEAQPGTGAGPGERAEVKDSSRRV
jgi:hypothetical protein